MTETCALSIGMMGEDYLFRPDATGRLCPPIQQLRIMGEGWRECPTGETGEIQVKSAVVMGGYLGRPEENAQALPDGWLATGDMGFVDAGTARRTS